MNRRSFLRTLAAGVSAAAVGALFREAPRQVAGLASLIGPDNDVNVYAAARRIGFDYRWEDGVVVAHA